VTTATTIKVQLQLRQDVAVNWTAYNPVLRAGELGRESDTGKIKIGNGSTSWTSLPYQPFGGQITNADISATAEIAVSKLADGAARQLLQTDAAGTGVEWTSNVDVPGTLDVTGTATFDDDVTIEGDLTVNGTTTTIDTETLLVKDKNIEMAVVDTPTDVTADGGGITLKGTTDKTINWIDATNAWTSSERFSYPLGSAADPALTFTGDPNTGIYSPGAGQVAISSSGSERIRIGANGEIGLSGANYGTSGQVLTSAGSGAAPTWTTPSAGNTDKIEEGNTSAEVIDTGSDGRFVVTTEGSERLRVDSSGRLGIGTTSPNQALEVVGSQWLRGAYTDTTALGFVGNSGTGRDFVIKRSAASTMSVEMSGRNAFNIVGNTGNTNCEITFSTTGASEAVRIDSSSRLLVGTSSNQLIGFTSTSSLQISAVGNPASIGLANYGNGGSDRATLNFARSKSNVNGTPGTIVANNDYLGSINFAGDDGTDMGTIAASITARVDGTPGANDMPGRLVFSTTADGASSPTERMRISAAGYLKASNTGSYRSATGNNHEFLSSNTSSCLLASASNTGYNNYVILSDCARAADAGYSFLVGRSNYTSSPDMEFDLRGNGAAYADISWNGGGADYAEYFEWSDGNTNQEDRRGISVILDGDKIRPAVAGEDPIGVISGNPSVVGDSAWNKWNGKHLRDDYGTYILEDYEVTDEDGNTVIQQRRKLNPAYDPDVEYIPREDRPEWDCVGLMGKLRIRKGQSTGTRWIKMRDISDSVEEWLVR